MADYDIIIRGGLIADGNGGQPFEGDIAVNGDRIVAVGRMDGSSTEEIDARGKVVTPGFVDIHTHYDGQVTWENTLAPSSTHGVTTVVMGNCGVGFAPCRSGDQQKTIKLMEGVEDVPEIVMDAGVPWNWQSFPEYLDALEQRRTDIDFAAQLPHSPLRVFVMGDRGARQEPPTEADLAEMRRLTAEAIRAGALGVSTSRSLGHRFPDGQLAPSVKTEEDELIALAEGLGDARAGVFQLIPHLEGDADQEFALMRRLVEASGNRPLSFSLLNMNSQRANWLKYLRHLEEVREDHTPIVAQFVPRPAGVLFGLDLSYHTFSLNPSYRAIADLPLAEKVRIMRDPAFRAKLMAERAEDPNPSFVSLVSDPRALFLRGDPPNYRQPPEASLEARAAAAGIPVREMIYDALLTDDGRAVLYSPSSNDLGVSIDEAGSLFDQPNAVMGLGDGGAHYGLICDASMPTYLLTDWVRDGRGGHLPLADAIKALTRDPAEAVGLADRGVIRVGAKADLNVLDIGSMRLHAPEVIRDLPADGRRVIQRADGYAATLVSGVVTYRDGVATGALPGRLIRGAQAAAA